jgi:biotin carboxylase
MTAAPERRLLVLGAGRHQAGLIERAEQRGIRVVASDYYPDAPGKARASFPQNVDALDVAANVALAERFAVDGVITTGTDMAVVTMADVADACGLPCYLTPRTARIATNKVLMSEHLARHGGRRPRSVAIGAGEDARAAVARLHHPVVVKPADSQGQRGMARVDDPERLEPAVADAIVASRTGSAIVEEFVTGPEVTASAWVSDGVPHVLVVTDRVTYNPPPHIGIAFRHVYPSAAAAGRLAEIVAQVRACAAAYEMAEGPLYIQMLVADDGVWIVEGGARVGGGHEAALIPHVTGVDLLDRLIDLALTGRAEPVTHDYDDTAPGTHALVNFLLARPGTVDRLAGYEDPPPGFVEGGFYVGEGFTQGEIVDSLGRVGWFLAEGDDRADMLARADAVYRHLRLEDGAGTDLLFLPEPETLLGA